MNRTQLKKAHKELSENQPFTKTEQKQFNKKDQSMIRNIQILNNFSKKQAIKVIKGYKSTPKETLKALAKEHRTRLKKFSSPQKPELQGVIKPHQKKLGKRTQGTYTENRKTVKKYLNNPANKNKVIYNKVLKGSKKYLDASEYELRYGVNSKKSQEYRERNGLSKKYEGRIIK